MDAPNCRQLFLLGKRSLVGGLEFPGLMGDSSLPHCELRLSWACQSLFFVWTAGWRQGQGESRGKGADKAPALVSPSVSLSDRRVTNAQLCPSVCSWSSPLMPLFIGQ